MIFGYYKGKSTCFVCQSVLMFRSCKDSTDQARTENKKPRKSIEPRDTETEVTGTVATRRLVCQASFMRAEEKQRNRDREERY